MSLLLGSNLVIQVAAQSTFLWPHYSVRKDPVASGKYSSYDRSAVTVLTKAV